MPNEFAGPPPTGEESPSIPSFASLRDPRRRSAVDLLMAGAPPAAAPVPDPVAAEVRPGAPRPAEYGDLLRFGVRLTRAAVTTPVRLVRWSLREPGRCRRRAAG